MKLDRNINVKKINELNQNDSQQLWSGVKCGARVKKAKRKKICGTRAVTDFCVIKEVIIDKF